MQYEWDENKQLANLIRHKVDFADAIDFEWDTALETIDDRLDYGEERWVVLGFIGKKFIMKNKRKHITKEDWDGVESPALSDEMLARMKSVSESHPEIPKRVRGPQKEPLKVPVSIRLSPDVAEYFKSQGKGWQTKINNILHDYMKTHGSNVTHLILE